MSKFLGPERKKEDKYKMPMDVTYETSLSFNSEGISVALSAVGHTKVSKIYLGSSLVSYKDFINNFIEYETYTTKEGIEHLPIYSHEYCSKLIEDVKTFSNLLEETLMPLIENGKKAYENNSEVKFSDEVYSESMANYLAAQKKNDILD